MSTQNSGSSPGKTWWVYIDVTTVCILLVLGVGGYWLKSYISKSHDDAIAAAERARLVQKEREEADNLRREEQARDARVERERLREEQTKRETEYKLQREEDIRRVEQRRKDAEKKQAEAEEQYRRDQEALKAEAERRRKEDQEAEAKRLEMEKAQLEIAKIRDVNTLKDIIATADRDIIEANKQLEPLRAKAVAFKNKMEGAAKQAEQSRKQISELEGSKVDVAGELAKARSKLELAQKEGSAAASGYDQAGIDRTKYDLMLTDAKGRRDRAISTLKTLGIEVATTAKTTVPSTTTTTTTPDSGKVVGRIYTMKDGRKFTAIKWVEAGDTISIKLESGKFEALDKDQIEKFEEIK